MASVAATMPDVAVVQFTDEKTPPVDGAFEVIRGKRRPMALMRFWHQSQVKGDWLFVDTDVVFQRDVRSVFDQPFDIAVTVRDWPHLKRASGFAERMPFNAGVVFSRTRKFWSRAYKRLLEMPVELHDFMGHQQVICDLVTEKRFHVAYVKGSRYNCPPYIDGGKPGGDPDLSAAMEQQAAILHYKGPVRKALMLDRLRSEGACG
jgi:lipopolysaccharide biosynthesis glycosyltransferase